MRYNVVQSTFLLKTKRVLSLEGKTIFVELKENKQNFVDSNEMPLTSNYSYPLLDDSTNSRQLFYVETVRVKVRHHKERVYKNL